MRQTAHIASTAFIIAATIVDTLARLTTLGPDFGTDPSDFANRGRMHPSGSPPETTTSGVLGWEDPTPQILANQQKRSLDLGEPTRTGLTGDTAPMMIVSALR